MKGYFFFLLILITSACSTVSDEKAENTNESLNTDTELIQTMFIDNFNKTFSGTIDNQYNIVMTLSLENENITGDYYYTKHNQKISLKGTFTNVSNEFTIQEFLDGEKTGTFTGIINEDYSLTGFWTSFSKSPGRVSSFPFELSVLENDFVWYSEDLPFHPYYISQLLNIGEDQPKVDFRKEVVLPKNIKMYEEQGEKPAGFTIDYDEDFYMRMPYFEYSFLGKLNNQYIVSISECGGGTGIFSGISILELNGSFLTEVKSVCAGDRCNGGIGSASLNGNKIIYSQNLTSEDLYLMADESIEKPTVSLDYCAMCCVGEAKYEYNIDTEETSFISFESYLDPVEVDMESASELDIFYSILGKHITDNGGTLNQLQVNSFVAEFIKLIAE